MHIGVHETPTAGPGDCHIKGGYVEGATTFTVKLAMVSFYKNLKRVSECRDAQPYRTNARTWTRRNTHFPSPARDRALCSFNTS
jgi:hypothetical protein